MMQFFPMWMYEPMLAALTMVSSPMNTLSPTCRGKNADLHNGPYKHIIRWLYSFIVRISLSNDIITLKTNLSKTSRKGLTCSYFIYCNKRVQLMATHPCASFLKGGARMTPLLIMQFLPTWIWAKSPLRMLHGWIMDCACSMYVCLEARKGEKNVRIKDITGSREDIVCVCRLAVWVCGYSEYCS